MKRLYIIFIFISHFSNLQAQNSELTGNWYLQYVEIDGTIHNLPEFPVNDESSYPSFNFTEDCHDTQCFFVSGLGTYSYLSGYYNLSGNTITFQELYQTLGSCTSLSADVCNYEGIYFSGVIFNSPEIYSINGTGNNATLTITTQSGNLAVYGRQSLSNPEFKTKTLVSISPNPVNEVLNVSSSESLINTKYSIYSINGKKIINFKRLEVGEINVSKLESGLYFLVLVSESNQYKTIKFIKE